MSATLDFATGPLNWVRGDIETALKGAAERVRAYGADPSLENALRLARDEVHMATGALRMVGLEGAAKVIASLEDVLSGMDSKAIASDDLNSKAVLDALEVLHKWVTRMAEGRGEGEHALFPTYRRLRQLACAEKIFEGELFYPILKLQMPVEAQAGVAEDELPQRVKAARASFQRGLLAFLRGTKAEAGLAPLCAASDVLSDYLVLLGSDVWPGIVSTAKVWDPTPGVAISFWAALSALSCLGLRYPLAMLPLLILQLSYKVVWLLAVARPLPLHRIGEGDDYRVHCGPRPGCDRDPLALRLVALRQSAWGSMEMTIRGAPISAGPEDGTRRHHNSMQRTAQRAAADAERWHLHRGESNQPQQCTALGGRQRSTRGHDP